MKTPGIYALVNTVNGKRYYGSSENCEHRFKVHVKELRAGRHVNRKLLNAWAKYGPDAFRFEVVEVVAVLEELLVREDAWIPKGEYNICQKAGKPPGMTRPWTPEERAMLSAARKGKPCPWLRGRKLSPESRERGAAKLRGRKRPPEVGLKISAATKGKPRPDVAERNLGNRHGAVQWSAERRVKHREMMSSPEMFEKQSAARRGRQQQAEHVAKRVAKQIGQKRTPEQRERMRAAHLGKPWTEAQRAARMKVIAEQPAHV